MSPFDTADEDRWDRLLSILIRTGVWATLFGVLFLLRSFSLLIFLTFVFGYIQSNGVERLAPKVPNRSLRVVIVALLLLSVLISIGAFIVPRVREQAVLFADRYPLYLQSLDAGIVDLSSKHPMLERMVDDMNAAHKIEGVWDPKNSPSGLFFQQWLGMAQNEDGNQHGLKHSIDTIRGVGSYVLGLGSTFLLSLLFSFLIVLDLPKLTEGVRGLRNTKIRFIYDEVAENVWSFGQVLGRALEAQLLIALLNTLLTGIGLMILGVTEKVAFLLVIVFVCSFIPVAGVFISSVPIGLVALQQSGLSLLLLAIVMITIVHLIEAYVLNPKIYGHHMHLNPVIVLIILTLGGKLFHVWGLVLGVPICTYIFGHAIRYRSAEEAQADQQSAIMEK